MMLILPLKWNLYEFLWIDTYFLGEEGMPENFANLKGVGLTIFQAEIFFACKATLTSVCERSPSTSYVGFVYVLKCVTCHMSAASTEINFDILFICFYIPFV